jgi:hypothetical protein
VEPRGEPEVVQQHAGVEHLDVEVGTGGRRDEQGQIEAAVAVIDEKPRRAVLQQLLDRIREPGAGPLESPGGTQIARGRPTTGENRPAPGRPAGQHASGEPARHHRLCSPAAVMPPSSGQPLPGR